MEATRITTMGVSLPVSRAAMKVASDGGDEGSRDLGPVSRGNAGVCERVDLSVVIGRNDSVFKEQNGR
jgi:hypothetical protein